MLVWLATSLGLSTARCGEEGGVGLCRDLGRKAPCHVALPVGGPPEAVKTPGQVHQGYSYPTWAVVGQRAALALAPPI